MIFNITSSLISLVILVVPFRINAQYEEKSRGQKISQAYQCGSGKELSDINSELAKIKNLSKDLFDTNNPECTSLVSQMSDIPPIEDLLKNELNDEVLIQLAIYEKEIEQLNSTLQILSVLAPDANERDWYPSESEINERILYLKSQIIAEKNQIEISKITTRRDNTEIAINNVDSYFNSLGELIKKNCYKEKNSNAISSSITSMTSVAGLLLSNPYGPIVLLGSKLLQKAISIGTNLQTSIRENRITNITDKVELFNGIKCATMNFSEKQCNLITKGKLYKELGEHEGKLSTCYAGMSHLEIIKSNFSNSMAAIQEFNSKTSDVGASGATSLQNLATLQSWESAGTNTKIDLLYHSTNFNKQTKETGADRNALESDLAKSNLRTISRYCGRIFNNNLNTRSQDFEQKQCLELILGKSGNTDLQFTKLRADYLSFKNNTKNPNDASLTMNDILHMKSEEMIEELMAKYWHENTKNFLPGSPSSLTEIFNSAKVDMQQIFETNLKTHTTLYKQALPIESDKITNNQKELDYSSFNSTIAAFNTSPLEAIDKLIGTKENPGYALQILSSRDTLVQNMENKIMSLKSSLASINEAIEKSEASTTKKKLINQRNITQKRIQILEGDLETIQTAGNNAITNELKSMVKSSTEIKSLWTEYTTLKKNNTLDARGSIDSIFSDNSSESTSTSKYNERKVELEDKLTKSIQGFMGYREDGSAENFEILQRELQVNLNIWESQIENVFEIPDQVQKSFALMQTGVLKDFIANRQKFDSDFQDITEALATSRSLIKANDRLFEPYLKDIAKYNNLIRKNEDPDSVKQGISSVKPGTKEAIYIEAELKQVKEFCLESLGFHNIPPQLIESCKGLRWYNGELGDYSIIFDEAVTKNFEERVCLPGKWRTMQRFRNLKLMSIEN